MNRRAERSIAWLGASALPTVACRLLPDSPSLRPLLRLLQHVPFHPHAQGKRGMRAADDQRCSCRQLALHEASRAGQTGAAANAHLPCLASASSCLLQGTAGGFAVQFGASKDSQTAADTQALAGAAESVGMCCEIKISLSRLDRVALHMAALACICAFTWLLFCQHCLRLVSGLACPAEPAAPAAPAYVRYTCAGNASTGAATYCFIQAIERRGTKLT